MIRLEGRKVERNLDTRLGKRNPSQDKYLLTNEIYWVLVLCSSFFSSSHPPPVGRVVYEVSFGESNRFGFGTGRYRT